MKLRLLHILLFFILVIPAESHAIGVIFDINAANNFTIGPDAGKNTFSELCKSSIEGNPNRVTGNIVRCGNAIISFGGDRLISNFVKPASSIVFYVVIIGILFHGIQMMYGVAKHQATIMTLIKIVIVMFVCGPDGYFFLKNTRNVLIGFPKNISSSLVSAPTTHQECVEDAGHIGEYPPVYVATNGGTTGDPSQCQKEDVTDISLTGFIIDLTGIKNLVCKPDGTTAIGTKCPAYRMEYLYDKFDESIMRIFGVKEDQITGGLKNNRDPQLFMGIVVLAVGLLFTGGWGALFAIQLFLIATATLFAIAEMVLFFMIVAVAINLLIAIAPMALACMLFKSTENITRRWFNYLFVYSLQPIVLVAFMVIMVTLLDKINKEYQVQNVSSKIDFGLMNTNGDTFGKMTIFNCLGNSLSSDANKNRMNDPNQLGGLSNQAFKQNIFNNLNIYGNGTAANQKNQEREDCKVKASMLKIFDDDVANNKKITLSDLKMLSALNIAIIILQLVMLSFLKEMPRMVAQMANAGGIQTATSIATNPTQVYAERGMTKISEAGRGFLRY